MRILAVFYEAFISLKASKLRSFLATLGIVIGVGSVVLMIAVGNGSRHAIEDSISKLGSNLLILTPGAKQVKGLRTLDMSYLNIKDAHAVAMVPDVSQVALSTRGRSFQLSIGKKNWNSQVTGVSPEFFPLRSWDIVSGSNFTDEDSRLGKRVAIIGASVANNLVGPGENPVGRVMKIGELSFRIIGLLENKGRSFDGRDQDDAVFVPFATAQIKLMGNMRFGAVDMIYIQVGSKDKITTAAEDITELMRQRQKLKATDDDSFMIRDMTAVSQVFTETTRAFSVLLGAIASISLVVGGIGIMNIMLVTVTERTREIGIRKAIGANNSVIMLQFLIESIVLVGIGSFTGLLIGMGLGLLIEHFLHMPVDISIWSVVLAISVTIGVGTLSGLYPARKAANLNPIEALRSVGA